MPRPVTVTVRKQNLLRSTRRIRTKVKSRTQSAIGRHIAKPLRAKIRATTPVDTGALRASTLAQPLPSNDGWRVGWRTPRLKGPKRPHLTQARAIEFGTAFMKARRTIRRAISYIVPRGQRALIRDLNRFLGGK